jgi:V8-like Glu-specific endopeptidase
MVDDKTLSKFARKVFPDLNAAQDEVSHALGELDRRSSADIEELSTIHRAGAAAPAAPPSDDRLKPILRAGMTGLRKTAEGEALTPPERRGVEAIVLLFGRPALLVQDDDFKNPPAEWSVLTARRAMLKKVIPSIGRIELENHHTYPWVGTGFLVASDVIMTNRHVAEVFAKKKGSKWVFTPPVKGKIDYREEYQRDKAREFRLTEILHIDGAYDLALLRVSKKGLKSEKSPVPLTVASSAPKAIKNRQVAVIGYPAFDSRNAENEMLRIFESIFNVKRMAPGEATRLSTMGGVKILEHDCSTLGGNSGSCVVDLETGQVLGLHFGGQYLVGNVAVPLWLLTKNKALKAAKVNFA